LERLRLNEDKDFVTEQKGRHRFDMATDNFGEHADTAALKESADGTSLIFLSNFRALVFHPHTLHLLFNLNSRVLDILGSTVLIQFEWKKDLRMSEISKLNEEPKILSLKDKISNENLEWCISGECFVLHEEKYFSFAVAKFKGNQIKILRFQVENCEIVSHEEIACFEANLNKD